MAAALVLAVTANREIRVTRQGGEDIELAAAVEFASFPYGTCGGRPATVARL